MKKFFVLMAVAALCVTACEVPDPSPAGSLALVSETIPWDGGEIELSLKANCNWQLTVATGTDLSFTPSSGTGDATVKATLPANKTNADLSLEFTFYLSTNDGQYNFTVISIPIAKPTLEYGEKSYSVVYLEDGNFWMAEPLSYIPYGDSVSDNPAEGTIFYPYSVIDGTAVPSNDESTIASNGYLYKADAFMGKAITADNCTALEGVQGICPTGWHIPTWTEWYNLVGASNALADGSKVSDNDKSIFWDADLGYASIVKANEKGFNFVFSGSIANSKYLATSTTAKTTDVEDFVGKLAMTYFACSTGILSSKGEPQMFAPMSTFTAKYPKGRLSLAYANTAKVASQVRCVKNAK